VNKICFIRKHILRLKCITAGWIILSGLPAVLFSQPVQPKSTVALHTLQNNETDSVLTHPAKSDYSVLWLKLDSIFHSQHTARHFAGLYKLATEAADKYIATLPDTPQMYLNRVQEKFAGFFLQGIEDANHRRLNSVWSPYYETRNLSPIQYKLVGANQHINGDSWKVLTGYFTEMELRDVAPYYRHCTIELYKVLDSLYVQMMANSRNLKTLHRLSFGLSKALMRDMLKKWRNRQLKIAFLYFSHKEKFARRLKKTDRKRNRIHRLIVKWV